MESAYSVDYLHGLVWAVYYESCDVFCTGLYYSVFSACNGVGSNVIYDICIAGLDSTGSFLASRIRGRPLLPFQCSQNPSQLQSPGRENHTLGRWSLGRRPRQLHLRTDPHPAPHRPRHPATARRHHRARHYRPCSLRRRSLPVLVFPP